jgi:hypothetical protein
MHQHAASMYVKAVSKRLKLNAGISTQAFSCMQGYIYCLPVVIMAQK